MKKLKLDTEALRVETFASDAAARPRRGTIAAHSWVSDVVNACSEPASQFCLSTDYHMETCGSSCIEECFGTGARCG